MRKRAYCTHCEYPLVTCVCSAIELMPVSSRIIILQHPSEVGHAKGTVRLIRLVIPTVEVFVGESAQDFTECRESITSSEGNVYLLYPENSEESELTLTQGCNQSRSTSELSELQATLVLIDGTWRKAKKILALNEWLHDMPKLTIKPQQTSQYYIRSSNIENGLSTIEALAIALQQIEITDTSPLLKAFKFMQYQQSKLRP